MYQDTFAESPTTVRTKVSVLKFRTKVSLLHFHFVVFEGRLARGFVSTTTTCMLFKDVSRKSSVF